jgi:Fe-Mn family superoxide dismutase
MANEPFPISRRELLKKLGAGALALAAFPLVPPAFGLKKEGEDKPPPIGFTLPALPYAFDALEPYIDARTMEIHHDKHHAAYVKNLNDALKDYPEWLTRPVWDVISSLTAIPEKVRQAVRNNGGGHANHLMFWESMKKGGGGAPQGELARDIVKSFKDFESFKNQLSETALKVFGSGWAWLSISAAGKLEIVPTPNQDTPLMDGGRPVLGLDVWEHAYYLKYQNRRVEYIAAWWNTVNWDAIGQRYVAARG